MNKIAIAAAAIGGFLLIGGGSAGVATAAGPIGIHSTADAPSLVIDVRRGGGRGFRGGGRGFHRGGAWRGRGVGWRGRGWRGRGVAWRGRGYRRGWRPGWVWRNGIWVAPLAYGAYSYGGSCERICARRWGWGGPNFRQCLANRGC
jgi:hypothetical protein